MNPRLPRHIGGLSLSRLRLELRRSVGALIVIALGIAAMLGTATYIAVRVAPGLTSSTFEARFAVDDATGVVKGVDEVRVLGVPAGRIKSVKLVDGRPVITADIKDEYGPLHQDARAALRPVTALQDMYLDIVDPGTKAAGRLRAGEVLPAAQTTTTVNVADVLNVFRADTRTRLRSLLVGLGTGLKDRGASLRAAFRELVPLLDVAGRTARQLADRGPITRRLVHNTAILTTELARSQAQLKTLVHDGNLTFTSLQAGSGDLDATLRGLPPTLDALSSSFARVRGVLGDVDTAVGDLRPVARQLPAALTALRQIGVDAAPAVRALAVPVRRLVPVAQDLTPLARQLRSSVSVLTPQVSAIDKVTRDLVTCKTGIQGFFQWNASMSKFGDVRGPVPRGNVVAGAQSTGLLNDPFEFAPQACTPGGVIGGRPPVAEDGH
jgi:phospholipid/cholesterol/gamma-HCH transport system substrate-binding protein